jgi:hypothetical protein
VGGRQGRRAFIAPNGHDDGRDGEEEDNFSRLSFLNASLIPGQN